MTETTPLRSGSIFFLGSRFFNRLTHWVVNTLYGQKMFIMPVNRCVVSGAAVFWYFERGERKFLMMEEADKKPRFCSFKQLPAGQTAASEIHQVAKKYFGQPFVKSLGLNALAEDSVAVAPTFNAIDNEVDEKITLQNLVWVSQITKEQASLVVGQESTKVIFLPEAQFLSSAVDPVHRAIYQSAIRHINHKSWLTSAALSGILQDYTDPDTDKQNTIH